MSNAKTCYIRRSRRVRQNIPRKADRRPRLSVFRSSKHIYAQVIDDGAGSTVATASTLEKEMRAKIGRGTDRNAAAAVGELIAERAAAKGIREVVFDRGGYLYHGRVKALANAARTGGLRF